VTLGTGAEFKGILLAQKVTSITKQLPFLQERIGGLPHTIISFTTDNNSLIFLLYNPINPSNFG